MQILSHMEEVVAVIHRCWIHVGQSVAIRVSYPVIWLTVVYHQVNQYSAFFRIETTHNVRQWRRYICPAHVSQHLLSLLHVFQGNVRLQLCWPNKIIIYKKTNPFNDSYSDRSYMQHKPVAVSQPAPALREGTIWLSPPIDFYSSFCTVKLRARTMPMLQHVVEGLTVL